MTISHHICQMTGNKQAEENQQGVMLSRIFFVLLMIACLSSFISSPVALILGFFFAHFFGHPFQQYNSKAVKWTLKIAVVGLGFGMNLNETMAAGKDGFALTVFSIVLTLTLGFFIGYLLKINRKTSHLISSGTAICGGSAIAAVAPAIDASDKDMAVSLGVVFFLNSIALISFPYIGIQLELSQHDFGLWSAIAIHDTSSVVGAASVYGEEALQVATTVKLARALWIIPVTIFSLLIFRGKGKGVKIPWFILLFIVAILVNSYLDFPPILSTSIQYSSKSILILTLFLIGAGLSVEKIKAAGWKPMILGISLWVIISVTSLTAILYLQ